AGPKIVHPRMHPGAFAVGNAVYVLGGFEDPTVWDDVVRATVAPDGALSPWTSAGQMPGPRSHFSVSVVDGYVFVAGGLAESAHQSPPDLKTVVRARVGTDGGLVEWTDMPELPVGMATHASFFYGGYLYLAGGVTSSAYQENRVFRAKVGADHALG